MKITIEQKRLKALERAEAKLAALEAGGVDNWEWYGESLKEYNSTIQLEEDAEEALEEICSMLAGGAYEPSERGAGVAYKEDSLEEAKKFILNLMRKK